MCTASQASPRLLPLAALIGALFGMTATDTLIAATLSINDCSDGVGSGTLRNTIAAAAPGATIQIPLMCSTITLTQGHIFLPAGLGNLYLVGQGPAATTIQGIDGDRVFVSAIPGTLELNDMTIEDGNYNGSTFPLGGCIYTVGSVGMVDTIVTGCKLSPVGGSSTAKGGAIYAKQFVTVINSSITGNVITAAPNQTSEGGGLYVGKGVNLSYVTISDNAAVSGSGGAPSRGGGLFATGAGNVVISNSTISGNSAGINSALEIAFPGSGSYTAGIISSTISENVSSTFQAAGSYLPIAVTNSTIAFNRVASTGSLSPAGLYSNQTITMNNSIFAENFSRVGTANDVFSRAASNPLAGSHDLITATSNPLVPFGTISTCPHLGHLSNNGGPTMTIPLLINSPALNVGAANAIATDQRGVGFSRTAGAGTDIGAYERQAGVIDDVMFFSEFESPCD